MSDDLDSLASSMFNNQVPTAFGTVGFLSLKPLSSWINDLNDRINFIHEWIKNDCPAAFWLSGLFFPQAFFTGALQNYARKHIIAIDELDYDFKVYDEIDPQDFTEKQLMEFSAMACTSKAPDGTRQFTCWMSPSPSSSTLRSH